MTITVLIPVGPSVANERWLDEAIESVVRQTFPASEVLLIDDGFPHVREKLLSSHIPLPPTADTVFTVWHSPWNLGVAHAFNCGVGLAANKLVFMLGSDDTLEPTCLEKCYAEYSSIGDDLAYYYCGVRYMDTNETQTMPCHAAMVTKALWKHIGGFPVQSASGAPDAALLSIMFGHGSAAGRIRPVANGEPLYNYRRHADTDTASKGPWQHVILETRDLVTSQWRPSDA